MVEKTEEKPADTVRFNSGASDTDFGRSWKKSDLQALKSPVLHALW